jgi:hypothetical protein
MLALQLLCRYDVMYEWSAVPFDRPSRDDDGLVERFSLKKEQVEPCLEIGIVALAGPAPVVRLWRFLGPFYSS